VVGSRLTPPSIQDGALGFEPKDVSYFDMDPSQMDGALDDVTAQRLGRECYDASTNWLNAGRRLKWNESLRSFSSLHPTGSKYLSNDFRYRSTFYRPKTRAMVRRDEASTAAAFFSNEDVVSITASDDDDPKQQASAEILKQLLQFRLTKTIPWFLTVLGARQDCEVMGACVGKAYWRYEEQAIGSVSRPRLDAKGKPMKDDNGEPIHDDVDLIKKLKDHPWVDLIALENFRIEPGCDWRVPIESSPYLIELEPVYIAEAMERMEQQHGGEPEWRQVSKSALFSATDLDDDVTRRAREAGRVPGKDHDAWKPRDFDICWTRVYTMRWGGRDWHFRTLAGAGEILTAPRPLEEVHLHGVRPYVMGSVVLEAHKTYPSAKVELVRDLQRAMNEDWNLRFDAVRMNLMPRQFVRNGAALDPNDLLSFRPNKIVALNTKVGEPLTNDVAWDRPPPPDQSAYAEQDRINLDFDELTGAFSNSSVQASQITQQSATGMHLMSGEASGLGEYELRLFAESFVEPLLMLLIKLEQAYETDPIVLALAGKKAQLFEKFGVSEINDELLNQEVAVRANVGIGATNPGMKLRNFVQAGEVLAKLYGPQTMAMGSNFEEIASEVFGLCGYKDGERFFKPDFDPRVTMLQQQLQQLQSKQKGQAGPGNDPSRLQAAQVQAQSRIAEKKIQQQTDMHTAQLDYQAKEMSETSENWRTMLDAHRELATANIQGQQAIDQRAADQIMHETAPQPQGTVG
jgi:hypothetical protein